MFITMISDLSVDWNPVETVMDNLHRLPRPEGRMALPRDIQQKMKPIHPT